MGWTALLLPTRGWRLYTRGGTNGVFLQKRDDNNQEIISEEVKIPSDLLRSLVAEDLRNQMIAKLEDLDDEGILSLIVR
jgi:hypothetical protein